MEKIIARINELSRKNKAMGLTPEEQAERDELRRIYLDNFKRNFRNQLDTIKYVEDEEDGGDSIKH
ncbi:DUF896 domain-containing protein [Paenibacillus sacheonensis]|uniref:UPF0291 protein GT003_03570 n=1 Tax=Paenibacillus sacheonensis TaxID=742054 RepID=A0A7X5BX00_9BACL|nr:DUF896 domain-containing protein [Paenibacillus sacheonensis]MBM7563373.1 uncharacterized protein YnzC (UPF0291/DUF896 family) [Paenibacillus sacheonensis]NBC68072.1 DUF896 domain-containing protein [Paenibacillus sacheonensis]